LITQRSTDTTYRMRALLVAVVGAAVFAAAAARRTSRATRCGLAEANEYPWQAAVFTKTDGLPTAEDFLESGILINDRYVLTELWNLYGDLSVILGVPNFSDITSETTIHAVAETKAHPDFDANGFGVYWLQDVALLRLANPVTTTPICLPSPGDVADAIAITSGWGGWDDDGNVKSTSLQVSEVKVLSDDKCKEALGSFADRLLGSAGGPDKTLCADGSDKKLESGERVCNDGGNPLIIKENGHYALIGMTYDSYCDFPQVPDVYTRVSEMLPWIKKNTGDARVHGGIRAP